MRREEEREEEEREGGKEMVYKPTNEVRFMCSICALVVERQNPGTSKIRVYLGTIINYTNKYIWIFITRHS